MSEFTTYLNVGYDHICTFEAYDHILFLIALCATYVIEEWKKVLILVTAFTLGHSLTLALATLNLIPVNSPLIEFLIPVTILLTALYNLTQNSNRKDKDHLFKSKETQKNIKLNYLLACFFGLIHGMGFSTKLITLLGKKSQIFIPLLSFNIGIELGQILIVSIIFASMIIANKILNIRPRDWNIFMSGAATGVSIILIFENKIW